jgi:glyoxylase-like metal-dependent hydrolase (beta-lactamase superfamily II)
VTAGQPFHVQSFAHNVIRVQEADHREEVALYLVAGSRNVAVIDTGLGSGDLSTLVRQLVSARPLVLQTHLHWDHIGASWRFADVRTHPAELQARMAGWPWDPPLDGPGPRSAGEASLIREPRPWGPGAAFRSTRHLLDGDRIDLGDRALEVFHTPGHSPGSVSFWDRDARAVFCGDLCYFGQMLLFVPASNLQDFRDSLRRLLRLAVQADAFYPAHGPAPLAGEEIAAIREAFELVCNGRDADWKGVYADHPVTIHDFGRFGFLLPAK